MNRTATSRLPGVALVAALVAVAIVGCTPAPTPPPPPPPPPIVFAPIEVTGVGEVRQGTTSDGELVIRMTELDADSLPSGDGAIDLVLTDAAGSRDAVSFAGAPSVAAPGSLGAAAAFTGRNVLRVTVVDTDRLNIEPMVVTGIRIEVSATAPTGPLGLSVGACTGSLAGCAADHELPSPGMVVAAS